MKKLIPDQIRQILACSDSHLSYRRLEQQIGISRASIGRILVAAALTGKSAIELLQLSDNELLEAIYPQTRSKYAEPDWQWIHSQLHRKGVTLQLLYDQFKLNSCHDVYSYTLENQMQHGSCVVTSVPPVKQWKEYINEPMIADSILDRLVVCSHRIQLTGDSMRAKMWYGGLQETMRKELESDRS